MSSECCPGESREVGRMIEDMHVRCRLHECSCSRLHGGQRRMLGIHSYSLSCCLEIGSLTKPRAMLGSASPPILFLLATKLGLLVHIVTHSFLCECWGFEFGSPFSYPLSHLPCAGPGIKEEKELSGHSRANEDEVTLITRYAVLTSWLCLNPSPA